MIYLHLFWAFFISNLLGYGGGPASIPLYQAEVVDHYHWLTLKQFGDVIAIANAMPGPISTKNWRGTGFLHTSILVIGSFLAMEWVKIHPAIVVVASLAYGAIFLS